MTRVNPPSTRLQALLKEARASEDYDVQGAMIEFAESISTRMRELGVTKAELARRLGKSKAFVTKVLGADANLTMRTQIALCRALECSLEIRAVARQQRASGSFHVMYAFHGRADKFDWERATRTLTRLQSTSEVSMKVEDPIETQVSKRFALKVRRITDTQDAQAIRVVDTKGAHWNRIINLIEHKYE